MKHFISIQATYAHAQIALFGNADCIEVFEQHGTQASSSLIPYISTLLSKHNLTLKDISFIAVDKGPGAFTSLRVSIATVNGIAFDKKVPLIGIDGLDALNMQASKAIEPCNTLVVLLNAYNNDVYYAISTNSTQSSTTMDKGCKKIDQLLEQLQPHKKVRFVGNGAQLHAEIITTIFGRESVILDPKLSTASAEAIGQLAYEQCSKKENFSFRIEPNYVKTQYFAIRNAPLKPQHS